MNKADAAVSRVLNQVRRGAALRSLISKRSQENLAKLASFRPLEGRSLLKTILRLDHLAVPITKIIVPGHISDKQNVPAVREFTQGILPAMGLVADSGVLDLRKAGMKKDFPYIEITPRIRKSSFEHELWAALSAADEIVHDEELGNLLLFRALNAARAELFALGEAKNASRKNGDLDAYRKTVGKMFGLARNLKILNENFPFGRPAYRNMLSEKVAIAELMVRRLNDPAAEASLTSTIDKILEIMDSQEAARAKQNISRKRNKGLEVRGGKIRIINDLRGECVVCSRGYKKSASGIVRKAFIEHSVSMHKVLSMFQHEIDSIAAERERNIKLAATLNEIIERMPGYWDKHLEAAEKMRDLKDIGKVKARDEVIAALELSLIPSDQARSLAKSLLAVAIIDLERRNTVLDAEIESISLLKDQTEELMGRIVKDFSHRWAEYFAKSPDLNDAERLKKITARLGKYLGTLFGKEVREHWLKQARSSVTGVVKQMSSLQAEVKRGDRVPSDAAVKAARGLLLIEFNFENRNREFRPGERKREVLTFYEAKAGIYGQGLLAGLELDPQTDISF